ncbi:MAG: hypothetical protein KME50_33395 [Nostoc desertorum CM1-VF14]|nr:hypothetical protein [Nostoc desertorum CM1-VF14]
MPLDWVKGRSHSFADVAIALFLLVSLLCLHNILTLELAKPHICLLLVSNWSLLQQHIS